MDNADPLPSWLNLSTRAEPPYTTIGGLARHERGRVHRSLVDHVRDHLEQGPPRIVEYGSLVNPDCAEVFPNGVSEILGLPDGSTFGTAAATGAWWRAGTKKRTRGHERDKLPEKKKSKKSKKTPG